MTLHELAATATPIVAVSTAGNQRPNFDAFERAGAALGAGAAGDPGLSGAIVLHRCLWTTCGEWLENVDNGPESVDNPVGRKISGKYFAKALAHLARVP